MEKGVKFRRFVLIGVFWAGLVWTASASAQSDFYKGKTITVYIGTTPGALYDQWSRLLAQYMPKHIPGKPDMISQNMPGAGHKIAANYLYAKTKPDGLSLIGSIVPSLYFDQLIGRPEVQYDWAKFVWIGSPVQGESQMYMRADTPYKTIDDVRSAKEPPRCGAQSVSIIARSSSSALATRCSSRQRNASFTMSKTMRSRTKARRWGFAGKGGDAKRGPSVCSQLTSRWFSRSRPRPYR